MDGAGKSVYTSSSNKNTAGLHRVSWSTSGGRGRGGGRAAQFSRMFGGRNSTQPGQYVVEISHGKTTIRKAFEIRGQASVSSIASPGEDSEIRIK
jgi:hypothetical protein